ncbi:MAG: cell division protein CrgA [Actinomycetota bacterium]|nr:cell division protein CrgA [Actinomycetota bacterium]
MSERRAKIERRRELKKKRAATRGLVTTGGRVQPPLPRKKPSPKWMLYLIFASLGLGFLLIFINYLGVLPGGASNWYLLAGIVLLAVGFYTATRYR